MVEYNLPSEKGRNYVKIFGGKNIDTMTTLIADDRVPMNTSQLMKRRLSLRDGPEDLKTTWMDGYFNTGDAILSHPDGRVKVVLDSTYLREMTPDTKISHGALILTPEQYDDMHGEEFMKGDFSKKNELLTREEAKNHPIWRALARDKSLLDEYTDYVFAQGKQQFDYNTMMRVYINPNGGSPDLRAWCVNGLNNRSNAYGGDDLNSNDEQFVGLASETQTSPSNENSQLEERVASALSKGEPFEHNGTIYIPTTDKHIKLEN